MRYLIIALLALAGCSKPPVPESKLFICLNPANPAYPIQVEFPNDNAKESAYGLKLIPGNGVEVTVPKALCMEVRKA